MDVVVCLGFKIKWIQSEVDKDDNTYEEVEDIYGARMYFAQGAKLHATHDIGRHGAKNDNDDEIVCVINSCDGAIHSVTKFCNKTVLTQTTSMLAPSSAREVKRDLAATGDLLSIMSTNGKDDTKILDNMFQHYFDKKNQRHEVVSALGKTNSNNMLMLA